MMRKMRKGFLILVALVQKQRKYCLRRREELDTLKAKIIDEIEGNLRQAYHLPS
jgi:hypothetical protein